MSARCLKSKVIIRRHHHQKISIHRLSGPRLVIVKTPFFIFFYFPLQLTRGFYVFSSSTDKAPENFLQFLHNNLSKKTSSGFKYFFLSSEKPVQNRIVN